jgi:hypothetical protein
MSATMDSGLFSNFFNHAPVVKVPGRTHPGMSLVPWADFAGNLDKTDSHGNHSLLVDIVSSYFLEDLLEATGHIIEEDSQYAMKEYEQIDRASLWVTSKGGEKKRAIVDLQSVGTEVSELYPGYSIPTRKSLDRVDESVINYELIEDVLDLLIVHPERNSTLLAPDGGDISFGSILIFLPGIGEIRSLLDRLSASRIFGDRQRFSLIPLHSKLSSTDQRKAFLPPNKGCRKIILSTNIAETSVTIPDVVVVIDCGREREVRRSKRTSTSILVTDWCSKANTKQRAGRAGRVQPGLCLKLFSSRKAESMKATAEPELKRVPLEEVCLSILASNLGKNCEHFLLQAPQPPSIDSIQAALTVLEEVGAITSSKNELTPLGKHLARLPVDVRLGKMLIFGSLFHCLDKVLTIAASLSSKSPFSTYLQDAATVKAKHKQFEDPDSDFVTLCNVWEGFDVARSASSKAGRSYCQSNYLNITAMHEIGIAKRDFLDLLSNIGFVSKDAAHLYNTTLWEKSIANKNSNNWTLIHAIVFAGLNPNVALLRESTPGCYNLWQKDHEIFFHRTSVNASKKRFKKDQIWVVFFEKFGSANRVSISTTCFINSIPLLLFGSKIDVLHLRRKVLVDNWMEIEMAAQVGVLMRQLREHIIGANGLLQKLIRKTNGTGDMDSQFIDNIVDIISPTFRKGQPMPR